MQAIFVQEGNSIDYTPGSDVAAGQVVVPAGSGLVGIAKQPIASGVLGALAVEGIFDVVQGAVTFAIGQAAYWKADGDPVGGTPGTGCAVESATGNTFMGYAIKATEATDSTVRIALRSVESSAAETLSLGDLGDVGAVAYDAGRILVADGDSFEDVVPSGDATISASGVITLNAAHAEEQVIIPVENLAAAADIADRPVFAHGRALTLVSAGILTQGAPAGVDDSNTVVIALKDDAGNTIVTKTYNTDGQPPTNYYADLGTLDPTHKVLTATEHVTLSVTQGGTTADMPAFVVILRFIPTNA